MMTFRKLTAAGAGKLIVAYLREQQVEPERDVRTQADKARDVETGERLNSYYTGREGRGAWAPHLGPRIADQLGIDIMKPPTDEGLARLFECKRADNGEGWSNHGRKRELCGFDFTAAPAKSVTLAAEFAPTREEQALLWQAIHQANDTAMAFVAKEVGVARRGSGDTSYIEEGDLEREGRVIVSRSLAIEKAKITVPLLISALFYDLAPDRTVTIPTQSERRVEPEEVIDEAAATLLAAQLKTPLQIGQHLVRAFEVGFEIGARPIDESVAEAVLSLRIDDLEPPLTRNGYDVRSLVEQFDTRPAEIRRLLRGDLDPARSAELIGEMRAAGLPT